MGLDALKTHGAIQRTGIAPMGDFRSALFCVVGFAWCVFLAGCYERKQQTVLNPDGSGKMLLETDVALPAGGAPGREKPTALSFGRQYTADLVNSGSGIEAWSDLEISEAADGRAHVAIVGYFSDLNKVRFKAPLELPLQFIWEVQGQEGKVRVERMHQAATDKLTAADARDMVKKAQEDYQDKRLAMHTQLDAFMMQIVFELPGEVTQASVFEKDAANKGRVSFMLDGKKVAAALDTFMANDGALSAMFQKGQDTSANDDLILSSMIGKPGPVEATVKIATHDTAKGQEPKPAFDYKTEMRTAELHQQEMFEQAGVELIPKFIVKPAATKPAQ